MTSDYRINRYDALFAARAGFAPLRYAMPVILFVLSMFTRFAMQGWRNTVALQGTHEEEVILPTLPVWPFLVAWLVLTALWVFFSRVRLSWGRRIPEGGTMSVSFSDEGLTYSYNHDSYRCEGFYATRAVLFAREHRKCFALYTADGRVMIIKKAMTPSDSLQADDEISSWLERHVRKFNISYDKV